MRHVASSMTAACAVEHPLDVVGRADRRVQHELVDTGGRVGVDLRLGRPGACTGHTLTITSLGCRPASAISDRSFVTRSAAPAGSRL